MERPPRGPLLFSVLERTRTSAYHHVFKLVKKEMLGTKKYSPPFIFTTPCKLKGVRLELFHGLGKCRSGKPFRDCPMIGSLPVRSAGESSLSAQACCRNSNCSRR